MFVSRDPFARTELHKECVYVPEHTGCDWCGGVCRTSTGRPYLWRYRTEHDGGRSEEQSHLFCGVGCMRTSHE